MQTGGRLQAAIEVIADMEARKRPAADALRDWGRDHRFAGSKDRAAIGNLVFDSLRWKRSLGWIMNSDAPRAIVLACYARKWEMGIERLDTAIASDRHSPEALSDPEHSALRTRDPAEAPADIQADCPDWLWANLAEVFGDAANAEVAALSARAPVDLRVNTLKANRDKILAQLSHIEPEPIALTENGIRIPAGTGFDRQPNIEAEAGWRKGAFEVQDAGSQLVAALSGVTGGMQVCDLCAGAGGKTLAMAALMENKGQIHAYDSDRNRLANIHDRLKRAGAHNVQVRDPARQPDFEDLAGKMDLVLVDAPCSGSGTWRRRPDAKWRLSEQALATRIEEQRTVLDAAVPLVTGGGRIVYITCSLLPQENDGQIAAFLERHEGFRVAAPDANARASLGDEAGNAILEQAIATPHGLMLTPASAGTDGFFISVLVKETA